MPHRTTTYHLHAEAQECVVDALRLAYETAYRYASQLRR